MTGNAPPRLSGPQLLYRTAVQALSEGRFEEGIKMLERLLPMIPPTADVYNNLGTAHWKCKRLDKAEQNYAKAVKLDPQNAIALNNFGALLMEQYRFDEAEKHLKRAYELKPGHASVANNMGLILCWRGQFERAERCFHEAIRARPNWSDAHDNLGNVYRDTRRWPRAEKAYHHALALDPDNAIAWRDLGDLYLKMEKNAEAEEALRKAIALRPQSENAWMLLLELLEFAGRTEELAETVRQGLAALPDSPGIVSIGVKPLRREGKLAEAIAEMERVAPKLRDNQLQGIIFYQELGQLYDRAGDADKAFAAFRQANERQKNSPDARAIDPAMYPAVTRRLQAQLTPALAARFPAAVEDDQPAPVFLVGFPRSGTTLLDQILSSHPGVLVAEEKPGADAMGAVFRDRFGGMKPSAAVNNVSVWHNSGYPASIPDMTTGDILEMRRAFWRTHDVDGVLQGRLFVDKMPTNLIHAAFLHAVFPKAKFIIALRHPCDCVLSGYMQAFDLNPAMLRFLDLEDSARFYDEMFTIWEQTRKILPLEAHLVRYENVVGDFRNEVAGLLSFLGLPWNDAVLEFDKTARAKERINTPSYEQVTQKIYTRASGRWLRYRKHLEPVLDILKPHAERYGYEIATEK